MKTKFATIKEYTAKNKGFTLVEMIVSLAVMSILISMYFSLFFAGGKNYEYIYNSYRSQNEARIAMSYITVKIRQNDYITTSETASVKVDSDGLGTWLEVLERDDAGSTTLKYIYCLGGRLMESSVQKWDVSGIVIAEGLDMLSFSSDDDEGSTCISILIKYDNSSREIKESIMLRNDSV